MNNFLPLRLATKCLAELEHRGFDLDVFNDFGAVADFVGEVGKQSVTPKMDPNRNDFSRGNCCWFELRSAEGPYAVIGARSEDLGAEGLGSYLLRTTNRHYGNQSGHVISRVASDSAISISGRVAYVGELHVPHGKRGRRDVLRLLVLFTIAMTTAEWDAEHVYAFFRERDVLAKMPHLYGFTDCIPGVMNWHESVPGRGSSEWLASISRPRVDHLTRLCLDDPYWLTLQSSGSE